MRYVKDLVTGYESDTDLIVRIRQERSRRRIKNQRSDAVVVTPIGRAALALALTGDSTKTVERVWGMDVLVSDELPADGEFLIVYRH